MEDCIATTRICCRLRLASGMIRNMATHRILIPDGMRSRKRRLILWDDKAGTVEGDHFTIPYIRQIFERPMPTQVGDNNYWTISDPAHHPGEFKILLRVLFWPSVEPPLVNMLPKVLRDAEMAAPDGPGGCTVIFPDGKRDARPVILTDANGKMEHKLSGTIKLVSVPDSDVWLAEDGREVRLGVF